jgi:hypothetical protein
MREAVAALWAVWCIYQIVQALHPYRSPQRLGYLLGAVLSGVTSYLLVTP